MTVILITKTEVYGDKLVNFGLKTDHECKKLFKVTTVDGTELLCGLSGYCSFMSDSLNQLIADSYQKIKGSLSGTVSFTQKEPIGKADNSTTTVAFNDGESIYCLELERTKNSCTVYGVRVTVDEFYIGSGQNPLRIARKALKLSIAESFDAISEFAMTSKEYDKLTREK